MYTSNDTAYWAQYPEWSHVFAVAAAGAVFPKAGVAAKFIGAGAEDIEMDETGFRARLHTNGDLFALVDGEWLRVVADTVDFLAKRK